MPDGLPPPRDRRGMPARALVMLSLADGLEPDPVILPADWAAEHLIVADGPNAGQRWSAALTPYAVEPLNELAAEAPDNVITIRKSAQTGLTGLGVAWLGYIVDAAPANTLVVFPTIVSGQDFSRQKLSPTIENTPRLRWRVRETRGRSGRASTALTKKFMGGAITITGANSASDLRSKTVRWLFCDEIDEWPLDLNGQGDPMGMADARQTAFHASGTYKKLQGSTPTIKGISRVEAAFEAGDQRFWHVPCPHCTELQVLEFGGKDQAWGLKFSTEWPHDAHYVCRHCGCRIEHHQKPAMVRAGEWIATAPGPGRSKSYHIDALSSLLTTWDKIVEQWVAAQDDPQKLKTFFNLVLGQAWEERGDAPEWQRLYARRETYPARQIPTGGVILTAAADVQADGIYYETVAWGLDGQSWSIDVGYLTGATADPTGDVWAQLSAVYSRRYPDAYGNAWPVERFAVDSGYNTNAVYQWVRQHPKAMAIKGEGGWNRAAIAGSPTKQDVTVSGRRLRRGVELWSIGTWPLKSQLYAWLRKEGLREGADADPPGYVHTSEAVHDDHWFRQVTAEFIAEREYRGRVTKEWVARGPNHYHDCRIYNMALAEHMGVGRMTPNEAASWLAARCRPPATAQGDLLPALLDAAPAATVAADAAPTVSKPPAAAPAPKQPPRRPRPGGGWVQGWRS